jgi:hypothetical protein
MIGDNDLDSIFDSGDFDEDVIFATSPSPTTVRAWFTAKTEGNQLYGVDVEAQAPTLVLKTTDVPANVTGMGVTVRGTSYTVKKSENSGVGVSTLYLKT